ncbi:MAG TPA: sensor histidine kinase [Spirochaetia bacterium]|nr:sensor histidine kinase [Spirochaetia bacterium]
MKRSKSRGIQTTIALAFAALVLATALIMAVLSFSFTQDAVQRSSREYTEQLVTQIQTNIDSYIAHMRNIAEVVQVNEQVQRYFGTAPEITPDEERELRRGITNFLNSISRTRDDISLILLASEDGRMIAHDPTIETNQSVDITELPFFLAASRQPGSAVISSSHVQNIVEGRYRWVITLSRTIHDEVPAGGASVLLVDLNFSVINDLVSRISLGNRGYLFIVDSSGGIVYHPRQELIYSDLEQEYIERVLETPNDSFTVSDAKGDRIYTVSTSERTGWRIVGVNYASEMVRNRRLIGRYYTYSTLAFVVVALITSILISHRLSRPILRLRHSMQAVEQGNFDISVDVSGKNEIGDLARDFTIMVTQIRELMRRNAEEHEQKRKSELLALQNQITPHFLYNTLDSIIWMAEGRQHENVVTTVSALARLLRLSVSKGDELISIHDEIEHIRSYLTIQKLRYRDRLDFSIDVDETVMRLRAPKVILQPLVENAIYHGIKNKEGGGRVAISAGLHAERVVLSVSDDGVGMSPERMRCVLEPQTDSGPQTTHEGLNGSRSRVGLRNVHERIQLYFGEEFGLTFRSNNGSGTIVDVRLPIIGQQGDSLHA